MHPEEQYLNLLRDILERGDERVDRTGIGTIAIHGATMRFDLADGTVPLFTTKKMPWKPAIRELLWFVSGETNLRPLLAQGVRIWSDWPLARYRAASGEDIDKAAFEQRVLEDDAFAATWGDLGPVYGKQWRRWRDYDGGEIDQIAQVVDTLRHDPHSRRILFTGWNVADLPDMALPPCHMTYLYAVMRGRLCCTLVQRSADVPLGVVWNCFEAAVLLRMLAQQAGLEPGELLWIGNDAHIYTNQIAGVRTQLERQPRPWPKLFIDRTPASIDDYRLEDFRIEGYDPHPFIKLPVAV